MRQSLIIFTLLISRMLFSQVGIGTTVPTKDLDINGELRVRNLPTQDLVTSNVLTTDIDGNIGQSSVFLPSSVTSEVAVTNIDRVVSGFTTIDDIDLGLSLTVTIPANNDAIVIINYSVPIGISSFSNALGYYGIRFLKDGIEAQAGSRKYAIVVSGATANMVTVSNIFTESFASSPVERVITYSLNGYIEQVGNIGNGNTHTYRFNMWSPTGTNFNWGRATITQQVFVN